MAKAKTQVKTTLEKKVKKVTKLVLSARVTPDVYMAWQNMANSKGLSVSECLRDAVTMVDKKPVLKAADGKEHLIKHKTIKENIGFPKESFSIDIVCKSEDGDDGHLGLISQLGGELDSLNYGINRCV